MYKKYLKLKNEKNLTDYKIAKDTGIASSTLSEWKNGRCTPKIKKIKILADYFGVTVDYFISDK